MSRQTVQIDWDDFGGGHYSSLGAFGGSKNQFGGTNGQVYKNGTLGPRPGFKRHTLNSGSWPSPTAGSLMRSIWTPAADSSTYPDGWWWIIHSTSGVGRRIDVSTLNASTYNGPINSDILDTTDDHGIQVIVWSNPSSIVIAGDSIVNPDTAATVATNYDGGGWPSSDVPDASAFYKDRQYFWGTQADNRIYYSEAQGSGASGAALFFNVGPGGSATTRWRVVNAWPLRNGLLICMQEYKGDSYGIWYMLSGASPESGTLREIDRGRRPAHELGAALWKDRVWFVPANGRGVTFHDGNHLDDATLDYLRPYDEYLPIGFEDSVVPKPAVGLTLEPGLVLPFTITDSGNPATPGGEGFAFDKAEDWFWGTNAFELVNGVWTKSAYWQGHANSSSFGDWYGLADMSEFKRDKICALLVDKGDGGSGGHDMEIVTRDLTLNRPGASSDTWSNKLVNESANLDASYRSSFIVRTSGYTPPPGRRCRIIEIQLDIDYWADAGGSNVFGTPSIDRVRVRHYGGIDADPTSYDDDSYVVDLMGDTAVSGSSWAEITGETPNRRTFSLFPDYNNTPWHGPFRLELYEVQNIAFRRITAVVELDDEGRRR